MKNCVAILSAILLIFVSCNQQPEGVLSEKEMENLLVDIHKTEAVITLNYSKYPGDEKKRVMREAVFMRHGTTQEQFDISLEWYGQHISKYMDIYDHVIERLQNENEIVKELIAQEDAQILTQEGDSVDIWKQDKFHIFNADKGENVLAFNINTDENFRRNDRFILRYHVVNAPHSGNKPRVYLAVRHKQHTIHYNYSQVEKEGWNTLDVQSDSTAHISEVYGYIAMSPRYDRHIMYIDSIELMRIHNKAGMTRLDYNIMSPAQERAADNNILPKVKKDYKKPTSKIKRQERIINQ